jgi:hypothetical protein
MGGIPAKIIEVLVFILLKKDCLLNEKESLVKKFFEIYFYRSIVGDLDAVR